MLRASVPSRTGKRANTATGIRPYTGSGSRRTKGKQKFDVKKRSKLTPYRGAALPTLEDLISDRDYTGAQSLLEFSAKHSEDIDSTKQEVERLLWIGYCAFHLGKFDRALEIYKQLVELSTKYPTKEYSDIPQDALLYLACTYFQMRQYSEAEKAALEHNGEGNVGLKTRLLYLIAVRTNQQDKATQYQKNLCSSHQDQLAVASVHYSSGQFQAATDIYKRLLYEDRTRMALHIYIAMCYYKLDYYDVSLDILSIYQQAFPDSVLACNIKACNQYRLHNGQQALTELNDLISTDNKLPPAHQNIIQHNTVVFSDGEGAQQVLPLLIDVLPEARLNLVIHHLRRESFEEALELLSATDDVTDAGDADTEHSNSQEIMLKATVFACTGQLHRNASHIHKAQRLFQSIGMSPNDCDTIPGRLCMASAFFLLKQFDDVNVYLSSVKSYMAKDDDFNWNYGISLAATGQYKEAEELLLLIEEEENILDICFISWLCRCYIRNGTAEKAWEIYEQVTESAGEDELQLLLLVIANDCYSVGHFLFSVRAFDALEKLDANGDFWKGKRGACIGVFQKCIAAVQQQDNSKWDKSLSRGESDLKEVVAILNASKAAESRQITSVLIKWATANGFRVK